MIGVVWVGLFPYGDGYLFALELALIAPVLRFGWYKGFGGIVEGFGVGCTGIGGEIPLLAGELLILFI